MIQGAAYHGMEEVRTVSMEEQPHDPLRDVGELVDSLRLAGIRFLPRQVPGFAVPVLPVAATPVLSVEQTPAEPARPVPPPLPVPPVPVVQPPPVPARTITLAPRPAPLAPSEELFALETVNESSTQGLSLEERAARLAALADQVSRCTKCPTLARERTRTVFGIGPLDAELCVIGEAPGAQEDLKGEPFVGEAGQLLDKILQACGFQRSQVYICNVLRCRPPANRVPELIEAQNCKPFLEATLDLVRPRFICLMGATAGRTVLETGTGIGALRGRELFWRGIPLAVTYHPAYLLRYPEKKRDTWEDMKRMLARMGRAVPP